MIISVHRHPPRGLYQEDSFQIGTSIIQNLKERMNKAAVELQREVGDDDGK